MTARTALPATMPDQRDPLPRHTTPTWEMELLISGATVFALLQLPAALDSTFYALFPRFERAAASLVMLPYVYLKSAAYALIGTFVLHLAMRGYWVALVGLRSVYPDGIRWEGLRWGPHYVATLRERMPSQDALIERADNRASSVFGFGIGFALLVLAPMLIVIVAVLLTYAAYTLLGGRIEWGRLWLICFFVSFGPFLLATVLDRLRGKHFAEHGRVARGLRALFRGYLRGGFSAFANYPAVMFLSRFGQGRGNLLLMLAMFVLFTLTFAQMFWSQDSGIGNYRYLDGPQPGDARTLIPAHYADQRGEAHLMAPQPFIPSEVVSGDYLRLFVPSRPSRDNPALERRCGAAATSDAAERTGVVLDCLAQIYAPAIDGVPVPAPAFDLAQDPVSGLYGAVAMIRVANLASGRHELTVSRPPAPGRENDESANRPYRIPFWR